MTITARPAGAIGAVIVYYNPDPALIQTQLGALARSVSHVSIVDNSSESNLHHVETLKPLFDHFSYESLGQNVGIASAQNRGLLPLLDSVDYILLLDQDSVPAPGMVAALRDGADELLRLGLDLAAIGPVPINRATGARYRARIPRRTRLLPGDRAIDRGEIISSGSLIPCAAFRAVGTFEDALFIDGVDHEWCWRARKKYGKVIAMSRSATLSHMLGEGDRTLLGVRVKVPTPFRTYYQVRNYFILARRDYVPLSWKISNLIKYCIKYCYFSLDRKNGKAFFRNMTKGAFDGIRHVLAGP